MKRSKFKSLSRSAALIVILLLAQNTLLHAQRIKTASDPGVDFRYGQILFEDNHFHAAIDILKRFQENNPEDIRSHQAQYKIGEAYLELEDYENAFRAFQRYTAVYPGGEQYGDAWFQQAECHMKMGNLYRAADLFNASAKSLFDTENYAARGLYKAAEVYLELGDNQKAYKAFHDLVDNYPDNSLFYPSMIQLAKLYADDGELLKAIRELDRIRRSNADNSSKQMALFLKGKYLFKLKQNTSAEEALLSAINNTEKSSFVYHDAVLWLTEYYNSTNRYDEALELLNDLSDVPDLPDDVRGKVNLITGISHFNSNDLDSAEETLLSAVTGLEGDNDQRKAVYYLGKTLKASGREEDAFNALHGIFTQDRFNNNNGRKVEEFESDAFRVFLSSAHATEAPVDISLYANNITRLSDEFSSVEQFIDWAEVLNGNGMLEPAANLLQKGIEKFQDTKTVDSLYYQLGRVYEIMDDNISAVRTYSRLLELYPGGETAALALERRDYLIRKVSVTSPQDILGEQVTVNNLLLRSGGSDLNPPDALRVGEFYYLVMRDSEQAARYFQMVMNGRDSSTEYMQAMKHTADMAYDNYFIAEFEENFAGMGTASERALTLYNDLIDRYPSEEISLTALDRIGEMATVQGSGDDQKLNMGMVALSQITPDPNSLLAEFSNYKIDELIVQYSSEPDSAEAAFRRINSMSLDRFTDDLCEDVYFRLAKAAYEREDYVNSILYSNKYMTKFPRGQNSPEIRYMGAVSLYHTGDKVTSREWINDLQDRFNYSKYADLGRILEGDILNWAGQYEEALALYRSEIIKQTENPSGSDVLTSLYWKTGETEENNYSFINAADYYRLYLELVESDEERVKGYYALANALIEVEKYTEGLEELGKVIQMGVDSTYYLDAKIKEAEVLMNKMEDNNAAQDKYQELAQMQLPDSSLIGFEYRYLSCLYRQDLRAQADREKRDFERKFRNLPEEMQDYYKGLLKVEEGNVHYRNSHLSPDRFEQAEDLYRDVINDYPATRQAQYAELYLGLTLLRQNEYEEGLPLLSQFDMRHPNSPYLYEVYKYLGVIQYTREQFSDAFLALNKAIKTAEGLRDSTVHKRYIDACEMSGFDDMTISAVREYLKHFPDAPDRVRKLEKIGIIYRSQRRYDEAIALFRDLLKEANLVEELDIQMYIAETYRNQENYTIAIAEYLKIIAYSEIDHPYAGAQFYLTMKYNIADCYEKIGQYDMAIKYLDEIIQREGANSMFSRQAAEVKDRINRKKRDLDKDGR
ncbi:MAG: tetratricopeptide repeat protein [bacterium]|nr:tetratricopeptide repeat protein [bacterium]